MWHRTCSGARGRLAMEGRCGSRRVGAYFADDLDKVVEQAVFATEVTHAHPEGIAGAIAIAVATACASRPDSENISRQDFIAQVLPHVPVGEVYEGIMRTRDLPESMSVSGSGCGARQWQSCLGAGYRAAGAVGLLAVIWTITKRRSGKRPALWAMSTPPVRWWAALWQHTPGLRVFRWTGCATESGCRNGLSAENRMSCELQS